MIPAHDSPLAALTFDWHGTKLATASEKVKSNLAQYQTEKFFNFFIWTFEIKKGTVIRVFSIPQGKRLFEFRRGVRRFFSWNFLPRLEIFFKTNICTALFLNRNALIYSLSFSPDSLYLSASSNLETIHIFRLEVPKEKYINRTSLIQLQVKLFILFEFWRPQEENQGSWMSYLNKAVQTAANYLPTQASDVLTQDRAFAHVNIPTSAQNFRNICVLT